MAAAPLLPSSAALGTDPTNQAMGPFAPCLDAAATTKSEDDTEYGLGAVQFLMTRSENYLGTHPKGEHGKHAFRLDTKASSPRTNSSQY